MDRTHLQDLQDNKWNAAALAQLPALLRLLLRYAARQPTQGLYALLPIGELKVAGQDVKMGELATAVTESARARSYYSSQQVLETC